MRASRHQRCQGAVLRVCGAHDMPCHGMMPCSTGAFGNERADAASGQVDQHAVQPQQYHYCVVLSALAGSNDSLNVLSIPGLAAALDCAGTQDHGPAPMARAESREHTRVCGGCRLRPANRSLIRRPARPAGRQEVSGLCPGAISKSMACMANGPWGPQRFLV